MPQTPPPQPKSDAKPTSFGRSSLTLRTPTKGQLQDNNRPPQDAKPVAKKTVKRKPTVMSYYDDDNDKENLDKNLSLPELSPITKENLLKESAKLNSNNISPTILAKIDLLFPKKAAGASNNPKSTTHSIETSKTNPGDPTSPEQIEIARLQRENSRLVDMLEKMSKQIDALQNQVATLIAQNSNKPSGSVTPQNSQHSPMEILASSQPAVLTTPKTLTGKNTKRAKKRKIKDTNTTLESNESFESVPTPKTGYIPPTPQIPLKNLPSTSTGIYKAPAMVQKPNAEPAPSKIPPIVLRNKSRWIMIAKKFESRKWAFTKAISTAEGIKFFPCTSDIFRAITRFLSDNGEEYHTYSLPEDKLLQVVLRGIPTEIPIKDIEAELVALGYNPSGLIRMKKGPQRLPMPLLIVKVPKDQTSIYQQSFTIPINGRKKPPNTNKKKKKGEEKNDDAHKGGDPGKRTTGGKISPKIQEKITQFQKTSTQTPGLDEEKQRMTKENLRLACLVDNLTKQLAAQTELLTRQSAQIEQLQIQLAQLVANQNKKAHLEDSEDNDIENAPSKRKRRENCSPKPATTASLTDFPPLRYTPPKQPSLPSQVAGNSQVTTSRAADKPASGYTPPEQPNHNAHQTSMDTDQLAEANKATTSAANMPAPSDTPVNPEYVPPSRAQLQDQENTKTSQQVPPIILRTKERWTMVSKELKHKGWHYSKAINIPEGVKIFPDTVDAYRSITKFFQTNGEQFHTYMLPEDKLLQVVIRGLPVEIDINEVATEIKELGFHPQNLIRLKKGPERKVMPLILVKLPKNEAAFYDTKTLCDMKKPCAYTYKIQILTKIRVP
ncbi:unnamed protein product [Brassicogethes aeneus]|uniref:Pre-C2HC domain-containing protein n=1 Tax=Brassicogethes aeneus TaxID=1431903 RepID=A0A9P0BGP9_BRAAE|nr:unnamed protein product [Brassicogethes aeneus]